MQKIILTSFILMTCACMSTQKYQPNLQLFMSPWSPPVWMKINHDYPVSPSQYNKMDPQ